MLKTVERLEISILGIRGFLIYVIFQLDDHFMGTNLPTQPVDR